ncbi:MAG: hypothetical protein HOK61_06280 [Alphaproteobacteria bacterium]|jgi:hypothetical protein|nr:hypothetical protein [Alphaproteobacteria bacterium]
MTTSDKGPTRGPEAKNTGNAEQLVRQFLDLWQDQISALAADPATAGMMAGWLKVQASMAELAMGAGQAMMEAASGTTEPVSAGTNRASPVAAASRRRDDDVAELARRIADCEARLAALEGAAGRKSSNPAKRPRSRKS